MSAALGAVLLPLLAAFGLGLAGSPLRGAYAHAAACAGLFALTLAVPFSPGAGLLHADPLGMIFGILTGFVGLTTAVTGIAFVRSEMTRFSWRRWRVIHATSQILLAATLLGLYADNIGLLWAAMQAAVIAACLGVSLPRTGPALRAAWQYFVLSAVGILLALFGTVVLYSAAQPGMDALSFAALTQHAAQLDGRLLSLAFVFLLFGYGIMAALVPLHGWLADACAQGPGPLTATWSGLLLNVPLIAILRFRHLLQANFLSGGGAVPPGPLLLALGLASLLLTAFSLWRQRDARRFFGVTSTLHAGLATFAFGIGGPAAIFAGLLQLLLHTLIKSALFQALIRAAPGHCGFGQFRGLPATNKNLGWLLGGCMFALTGLPPSGLFTSEFLIVSQTIQRVPWLSLPLGIGLVVSGIAVIRRLGPLLYGPPPNAEKRPAGFDLGLTWLHLAAGLVLAFAMPWPLVRALSGIAEALQ